MWCADFYSTILLFQCNDEFVLFYIYQSISIKYVFVIFRTTRRNFIFFLIEFIFFLYLWFIFNIIHIKLFIIVHKKILKMNFFIDTHNLKKSLIRVLISFSQRRRPSFRWYFKLCDFFHNLCFTREFLHKYICVCVSTNIFICVRVSIYSVADFFFFEKQRAEQNDFLLSLYWDILH